MKKLLATAIQSTLDAEIASRRSRAGRRRRNERRVHPLATSVGKFDLFVPSGYRTEILNYFARNEARVLTSLKLFVVLGGAGCDGVRSFAQMLCGHALPQPLIATMTREVNTEVARFVWRDLQKECPDTSNSIDALWGAFLCDEA